MSGLWVVPGGATARGCWIKQAWPHLDMAAGLAAFGLIIAVVMARGAQVSLSRSIAAVMVGGAVGLGWFVKAYAIAQTSF